MQRGLSIWLVGKSRIHPDRHNLPELIVVVDDGINLLPIRHDRGENCA